MSGLDTPDTLIDRLKETRTLTREQWVRLITGCDKATEAWLFDEARAVRHSVYGRDVYIRGLIEISNICKNDCLYCGIRRSNRNADRYRLTSEQILACAEYGYRLGFRTFVLQGGEDSYYTDELMCELVAELKQKYPDCAVTLSLGERGEKSFTRLFEAGADRYLLRHETANPEHYASIHPPEMKLSDRLECLRALKRIGYQVGSGFMVGSPGQTAENLAEDMLLLQELQPQMVGIGPFIPHKDTPFGSRPAGTVELTVRLLAMIRLMLPHALIPATTALGTLDPDGREKGILAGANVIMPNLSPPDTREKYSLYDNKLCTGDEAAESLNSLKKRIESIGYRIVEERGDYKP